MPGQIVKRGDRTWLVRVAMGRKEDGRRAYHNHTVKGTKRDAERYLAQVLHQRDTGIFVQPTRETVAEFMRRWLRDCVTPRVRDGTLADYERIANQQLLPAIGHRPLSAITPAEIQALYSSLSQ